MMHTDPTRYTIKLPEVKLGVCPGYIHPVTVASPLPLRRAVYRLAQFFRREFDYDVVQYGFEGREDDDDHVAFLFNHPLYSSFPKHNALAIGACCFRWRRWSDAPEGWALQWVWLHPYFRNHGHLSNAWPIFRNLFGDFHVEEPLSPAMKAFLSKPHDGLPLSEAHDHHYDIEVEPNAADQIRTMLADDLQHHRFVGQGAAHGDEKVLVTKK